METVKLGVAYMGSYLPWHLEQDLEDIYNSGCDEVLVNLQENDFHYQWGKAQFSARIAHKIGLKAIVNFWGYACMLDGGGMSKLLTDNPESWQVNREVRRIGVGCMNNPAVYSTLMEMTEDAASHDFDGFFIDELNRDECFCKHCQEGYKREYSASIFEATPKNLLQFRRRLVVKFIERVFKGVKAIDPRLETLTCIMPKD